MEVILLEKVHNLGNLGQKVRVKNGYARNYLIPQKKAVTATVKNIELFETKRGEFESKAQEHLDAAHTRSLALANVQVKITAAATDEGKLYGSIGTRELADAISKTGVEVEKREIALPQGAFHVTGEHQFSVILHTDVVIPMTVVIEAAK